VRNSVGFAWHPDTAELWFTDNGRDLLGDNLPDCELNRVSGMGQFFGFPYCHSLGVGNPYLRDANVIVPLTDPDTNNASSVMDCQSGQLRLLPSSLTCCHVQSYAGPQRRPSPPAPPHTPAPPPAEDGYVRAVQPLGPHYAPLGLAFYRSELGGMFPASYDRTALIAIHGSWNRWGRS
jgi:glucose/arabinose dehydrogenase